MIGQLLQEDSFAIILPTRSASSLYELNTTLIGDINLNLLINDRIMQHKSLLLSELEWNINANGPIPILINKDTTLLK